MHAAHRAGLNFVGVKEDDSRHGKADFALEKLQAMEGGTDGGPVNEHAEDNLHLLSDLCFINFRREQHEVPGMLGEIARQFAEDAPLVCTLSHQSSGSSSGGGGGGGGARPATAPLGVTVIGHREVTWPSRHTVRRHPHTTCGLSPPSTRART
jgi:hypothetical protein